jgi:hypothetical protein
MSALSGTSVTIAGLALLWLAIAVVIAIAAARRFRLAQTVLGAARANAALLEAAPARPLLVRPDLRLEADARLLRDLGFKKAPARLSDLAGKDRGMVPMDL